MSKQTFWLGIALLGGGLILLPCLFVGLIAVVNGLATGNTRLAITGVCFAGGAVLLSSLLWWLLRRSRPAASVTDD